MLVNSFFSLFNFIFKFLVDKEFIEERCRSLKRYLQMLCRHPIIYDTEIIKFFLTFLGTVRVFYQFIRLFLIYLLQ